MSASPPSVASEAKPTGRRPKILWLQVSALATIQGAVVLAWVVYNLYLQKLLETFGFSPGTATIVVFVENLLATLIEPVMGGLSDLSQRWLGSRFPFIAVGIVLSASLFILIPTVWILGDWGQALELLRPLFPVVLVLWALAMTIFRSPALSLLKRYALNSRLTQAASLLTLTEGIARGLGFLTSPWILKIGPVFAFGLGSLALLASAIVLLLVKPNSQVETQKPLTGKSEVNPGRSVLLKEPSTIAGVDPPGTVPPGTIPIALSFAKIGLIFGAGVGVSLGFRLFMATFSRVLKQIEIPEVTTRLILGSLFLSMSLTSLPLGNLGMRLGTRRGMLVGLTLMAGLCSSIALISSPGLGMLVAISVGAAFSLVSNATVPFALSLVPTERSGLGTAIYFSGGSIAATLLSGTLAKLQNVNPAVAALLGAVSFLLAGFFVAASQNDRSNDRSKAHSNANPT